MEYGEELDLELLLEREGQKLIEVLWNLPSNIWSKTEKTEHGERYGRINIQNLYFNFGDLSFRIERKREYGTRPTHMDGSGREDYDNIGYKFLVSKGEEEIFAEYSPSAESIDEGYVDMAKTLFLRAFGKYKISRPPENPLIEKDEEERRKWHQIRIDTLQKAISSLREGICILEKNPSKQGENTK